MFAVLKNFVAAVKISIEAVEKLVAALKHFCRGMVEKLVAAVKQLVVVAEKLVAAVKKFCRGMVKKNKSRRSKK